jgi:hypothetical protein
VNECKPLISGEDAGYCETVYKQVRLEAAVQGMTISVTAVTNLILMAAAKTFSRFERHPTISATEAGAYTRPLFGST